MVLPVVVYEVHAVLGRVHVGVVGVGEDEPSCNGFRGLCGSGLRGNVADAHRQAELQGVGVFQPFADVPVIDAVVVAPGGSVEVNVVGERFDCGVKLVEHL